MAVFVGLDLGTSALKAVALDHDGNVSATAAAGYPTDRPEPGAAEQQTEHWLAALRSVLAELATVIPAVQWRAVGLAAMIPCLVTTAGDGTVTGPALTWEDGRAEPEAAELRAALDADRLYRTTGQWVDGRYLLPMLRRLARTDPPRLRRTEVVMSAKDYLFHWLTGQLATDPSTATGYGGYDLASGRWDPKALAAVDLPTVHPPPVRPADTVAPLLPERAAELQLPEALAVCLGAADSVLGASALGVRHAGAVAYITGTSTVILGLHDELALDPSHRFLLTPTEHADRWGLEMDLVASGSALRWLADLFGLPNEAALMALAGEVAPGAGPVFLPYLGPGEQGALWDPELTGTVTGLTLRHDRRAVARALVDGLLLESRRCLSVLDEFMSDDGVVHTAGPMASCDWFRAQLADATRRSVATPPPFAAHASAVGAARLAAAATGQKLAESRSGAELDFPDADRAERWDELWARHERWRTVTVRR